MKAEQAFLQLFKALMPKSATVTIGTVVSVNENEHTCDVARDGQPTLFNCRLNAVVDTLSSHVTALPAVGSFVLCLLLDETEALIISTSEVEKLSVKIGSSTLLVDKSEIVMNDGSLGGLIKIGELTGKLNELVNKFNAHTHPVSTTGSASAQTGTASATTAPASPFKQSDYENLKVKQ